MDPDKVHAPLAPPVATAAGEGASKRRERALSIRLPSENGADSATRGASFACQSDGGTLKIVGNA